MDSFLITVDGAEHEASLATVRHLLDTSARFRLDLGGMDRGTADGLLRDTFGFHELAVEDAEHFRSGPARMAQRRRHRLARQARAPAARDTA
jgi:hypothetical protein